MLDSTLLNMNDLLKLHLVIGCSINPVNYLLKQCNGVDSLMDQFLKPIDNLGCAHSIASVITQNLSMLVAQLGT